MDYSAVLLIERKCQHLSECFKSPFLDLKAMGYQRTSAYWIPNRDKGNYAPENIAIEINYRNTCRKNVI